MTVPSQFAEIVERDAHSFSIAVAPTPAMEDRRALIALVREARGLLDELEISRNQCGVYNGKTWIERRAAFLKATEGVK